MLNFVQFINDEWTAAAEEKIAFLDDYVADFGYEEMIDDGDGGLIPNPISKSEFANQVITDIIRRSPNRIRQRRAEEAATWDEVILE